MLFTVLFQTNCKAFSAKSYALIDAENGRLLCGGNENERLPMASTTKIMTAYLAIENSNPDDIVTVSKNAASTEGSSIYLKAGEKISMRELLYGLMLESGNDAAVAIAEHVSGTTQEFAEAMTRKAQEMGALNTAFKNPNGLNAEGHYTTAKDLALITRAALKHPFFAEIVGTKSIRLSRSTYTNHNKLLSMYEGITGVKTGFTKKCGRCLVSSCSRNGFSLIAVTLNDPDDWNDHMLLYDKAYSEYCYTQLISDGKAFGAVKTDEGVSINLMYKDGIGVYLNDDEKNRVVISYDLPDTAELPVYKGQKVGTAAAELDGIKLGECDIVSSEDVQAKQKGFVRVLYNTLCVWLSAY